MAKAPADRPWDAAAVGQALKELRDKAERGEAIPMVWPEPGLGRRPSSRGPRWAFRSRRPGRRSRKSGTLAGFSSGFATRGDGGGTRRTAPRARWCSRSPGWWPPCSPSADSSATGSGPPARSTCIHQAEALMASSHRSDRLTARDEYLDALDRKFPDHPYKEQAPQVARPDPPRGGRGPRQDPEQPGQDSAHRAPERRRAASTSPTTASPPRPPRRATRSRPRSYWREMSKAVQPRRSATRGSGTSWP